MSRYDIPQYNPGFIPNEGELVQEFYVRMLRETKCLHLDPEVFRMSGQFHEVTTRFHRLEMEEWIFEHVEQGAYYCTNIYGGPASWFFNDSSIAVLFKLMFSEN